MDYLAYSLIGTAALFSPFVAVVVYFGIKDLIETRARH